MREERPMISEAAALVGPTRLKSLLEALIFASPEPVSLKELQTICSESRSEGEARMIEVSEIEGIIAELNQECDEAGRPYRIVKIAGGYQYATLSDYAAWIGKLYKVQSRRKLSHSSIESLAIIAYKQPISKPEIEAIRGVNCDYVLKTLLEKELVTIVGRAPTVGRPLLYGTTKEFLKHFGLNELTDLPRPREIEELLGDSRYETERRMLEAQEKEVEAKKTEEDFKSRLPHIPKKKPELDESAKIIPGKRKRELKITKEESPGETQQDLSFDEKQLPPEQIPESASADEVETVTDSKAQDDYELGEMLNDAQLPAGPFSTEDVDALSLAGRETETGELSTEIPTPESKVGQASADDVIENVPSRRDEETGVVAGQVETVEVVEQPVQDVPAIFEEKTTSLDGERSEVTQEVERAATKTKWQTWKEKIQGFLKKLFA